MQSSCGVDLVREQIAIVAGPRDWNTTRESWLASVPRRVHSLTGARISFRTVRSLWYGVIKNPDEHWTAREIRRAVSVIEARKEARALADQYQNIIGGLRASDENFYSTEIARLERIARIISGQDSS
jgi:hypothetical protein